MRQRVPFVSNQADVEISAFGGADLPIEYAPLVQLLAFSFVTAAATVTLRVWYAAAAGAATDNQIEIFNQVVAVGAIAAGRHVTIIGGQNACQNAWRDEATNAVWTLRATVTGLGGGDTWNARVNWILGRGVT